MSDPIFDYRKLKGRIKEKFNTQDNFASALGIGRVSLSQRLNNQLEFDSKEIFRAVKLLGLEEKDIPEYFFCSISSETRTESA
jgi:hypothetical protein|nr:MAG TPA: Protein of unknown function (DUF739) [Caudoviricetes sp.]